MKVCKGYGARVAQIRKAMNLSMVAFAKSALSTNASAKNIGRIEQEEVVPRLSTLAKLATFARVDLKWLAEGNVVLKPGDVVRTPGVGQRIAQARRARGMTRLGLSRAAGLGASTKNISRLESEEHRPRYSTLERIASELKVPVGYLAFGSN